MRAIIREITEKDIDRFWSKVDVRGPDECWPWLAAKMPNEYGAFALRHNVIFGAHQVAAYLGLGPPEPITLYALHTCDNPPCCNFFHLFYGTNKDNQDDASRKCRHRLQKHPEFARGERNGKAKLTTEQVLQIRSSSLKQIELSELYGVSQTNISEIKLGKIWRLCTIQI